MSASDFLLLRQELDALKLEVRSLKERLENAKPVAALFSPPVVNVPPVVPVDKRTKAWRHRDRA